MSKKLMSKKLMSKKLMSTGFLGMGYFIDSKICKPCKNVDKKLMSTAESWELYPIN